MFVGESLVAACAGVVFLSLLTRLLPDEKDDTGIFDKPFKKSYDYIVIGAGSAGSIVASRLSEDPVSVLLLEAGGSDYESENTRIPFQWRRNIESYRDWKFKTVPQKYSQFSIDDKTSALPRGKVLGGTGSINGMAFIRGSRFDFDQWEKEGCEGWGYNDVLPYFKKLEDIQIPELKKSAYHGKRGPITIREAHTSPTGYLHRLAALEKGLPIVDVNGESQIGRSRSTDWCTHNLYGYSTLQVNIKNGERCSSASCHLRPVFSRSNLQVNTNSHVTRIIMRNTTAEGVLVKRNGRMFTILARKEIILSAGAISSPQLLMLSGIGIKSHLNDKGIPLIAELPVGSMLQDHMQLFFHYSTNSTLAMTKDSALKLPNVLEYVFYRQGILSTTGGDCHIFLNIANNASELPDVQLGFSGMPSKANNTKCAFNKMQARGEFGTAVQQYSNGFVVSLRKLHFKSTGTIRLKSKNPHDEPLIDPNYFSNSDDIESYLQIIRYVQNFANNSAWDSIGATFIRQEECEGFCMDKVYDSDDYWRCIIRHYTRGANHQTSTCRMGAHNDSTAVVDSSLRVHGIDNLRVVDASVMRNDVSGNTNAATMMIAEKASDMIKLARG